MSKTVAVVTANFKHTLKPSIFRGFFYFYLMIKLTVECCANSVQSAINGQAGGAQRIELCANLELEGTTPSAAAICMAREALEIDLFVLIRPRGGDFVYSELELEEMIQDIEFCKEIGCDGVVIGALNEDLTINEYQTKAMVQAAHPMQVTFHRAFDKVEDPFQAMQSIIDCGCQRILTSGQAESAIQGIKVLKELVKKADSRISIMAGGGLTAVNVLQFYPIGIREFHLSGTNKKQSGVRQTQVKNIEEVLENLEGLE